MTESGAGGERDDGEWRRLRSRRGERRDSEMRLRGKIQKRNEIRNSKSRLKMIRKVEKFALRETRTHLRSKLLPCGFDAGGGDGNERIAEGKKEKWN